MRKKIKKEELKVGDYAYVVYGSIDYFRNNGYYYKVVEISEVFDERKQKNYHRCKSRYRRSFLYF